MYICVYKKIDMYACLLIYAYICIYLSLLYVSFHEQDIMKLQNPYIKSIADIATKSVGDLRPFEAAFTRGSTNAGSISLQTADPSEQSP